MYHTHRIDGLRSSILLGFHVIALSALAFPFQAIYLPIMIGMYLFIGFSTTLYLHRCLTHRALETTGWIKALGCLGTAVGQQGDPVGWVGHHRWHHAKTDHAEDVHSPVHGFSYAHFGWILRDPGEEEAQVRQLANDLRSRYPYLKWAENSVLFFLPHLVVALAIFGLFGWGGMAWCLYVPMIGVYHATWAVNSLCHMPSFGYRTTETPDRSRNFWLVGLLALGEGWHNNHHACQTRAPQGLGWREPDPTAWLIAGLERLGLVWDVRWTGKREVRVTTWAAAEAPQAAQAP